MTKRYLHGLCELVERDAIALWHFATPARQAASRIDPDSVNVDVAADIIRKLRAAEIQPIIWDVAGDVVLRPSASCSMTRPPIP